MTQQTPPSTGRDTDDPLILASQAAASSTVQGVDVEATTHPFGLSTGHPLLFNPWNRIAPSTMPIPSLNATAALPSHGPQRNGANDAQFDFPAPQKSHPAQNCVKEDKSQVENGDTTSQETVPLPQENKTVGVDAGTVEPEDEVSSDDLSDVQMSDRSESESDDDLDRQARYAFNHTCQAYDHRVPQNLTGGTTLFAEKVCMGTPIQKHLDKADKQGKINIRPSLVPHELEMKPTTKAVECIWVGMLPAVVQDDGDDTSKVPKTPSKSQKRAKKCYSVIDLEDDQLNIIPHDPSALRVVAKIQSKPVKTWHLYALTASDTGSKLCQGWKTGPEEVFFFKAFRDDTATSLMRRRQATELKIKAVISPLGSVPSALVSHSSPPSKHATSPAAGLVTPTTSNLPSPETSGQKEKSSRTSRPTAATVTENQTSQDGDPLLEEDDQAGSPANSKDGDKSAVVNEQPAAGVDPRGADAVDGDGDENAYPDHAVSSSDAAYQSYVDGMLGDFSVIEPDEGMNLGQKRKRVAFTPGCNEFANTRRKTGSSSLGDTQARHGEDDGAEPSSFVITQQADHLALKLKNMADKLVAKQDIAGLRQCVTIMGCIEHRGRPSPNRALAPYLSISSKKDADPQACNGKLREILDLFPNLEDVDGLDSHILAFMVRGLRETGQSIEIGLVEPCIRSYSRLYKQKYGDTRLTTMARPDLIDMICQARDDAEAFLKKAPLNKTVHGRSKKSKGGGVDFTVDFA